MLDRTRGARTAPALARGIFEPAAVATTVGRDDDGSLDEDEAAVEDVAVAVAAAR